MTRTIQCNQCGAGLAASAKSDTGELTCDYCGSVTRDKHIPAQAFDKQRYISPKHCPRCHHKTVETDTMGCRLRTCHQCGGIWVPIVALRKIGRMPRDVYDRLTAINKSKLQRKPTQAKARHGALKCPACSKAMIQHVYANGTRHGVAVDVCRKHGAWFDEDELVIAHKGVARRLGLNIDDVEKNIVDLNVGMTDIESRVLTGAVAALVFILMKVLE